MSDTDWLTKFWGKMEKEISEFLRESESMPIWDYLPDLDKMKKLMEERGIE